jgi:hypothetical protein
MEYLCLNLANHVSEQEVATHATLPTSIYANKAPAGPP